MGILTSIFMGERETRASLANPDSWLTQVFGGQPTDSGITVDESTALKFSAVYACVRVLSEAVASLPLPVYRRLTPRGKVRDTDHHLYSILHDRPNPEMSSFVFRETMMGHVVLWGNAYAEIERDRAGRVIGLWPLLPDRTWPERKNKVLSYVTRVNNQEFRLPAHRVLHIRGRGFDGLRGLSPIGYHRQAIGLGLATEEFGARFFGSGARPSGVLEFDGRFKDQDEREDFRKQFGAVLQGLSNAHRVAVLEQGMKWKQTSIPPEDAQFLATRQFQVREIARIFGVQPHLIGDLEQATFSNIEQQGLEFVVYTLRPWLVRWEQALNDALVPSAESGEVFAEFLVDGLLRGDIASRYTAYQAGRQNGWLSANDVRELENLNPLPGDQGDVYLIPLNMVPADQVGQDALPADGPPVRGNTSQVVEARSLASRRRTQRAHVALLTAAVARIVRAEVQAGTRATKQAFGEGGGGKDQFLDWAREFYQAHRGTITRQMLPAVMALAGTIHAEASAEIGADEDMTAEMEVFVRDYTESMANRMATSSEGQLRKLATETAPDQMHDALTQRFTEWEETRPAKLAARESVQIGSAIAKAAWAANGVRRLVWRANPGHCPLCGELDGNTVEITRTFRSPGDVVNPEGDTAPLEVTQSFGHPPLHEGCDCSISPA